MLAEAGFQGQPEMLWFRIFFVWSLFWSGKLDLGRMTVGVMLAPEGSYPYIYNIQNVGICFNYIYKIVLVASVRHSQFFAQSQLGLATRLHRSQAQLASNLCILMNVIHESILKEAPRRKNKECGRPPHHLWPTHSTQWMKWCFAAYEHIASEDCHSDFTLEVGRKC